MTGSNDQQTCRLSRWQLLTIAVQAAVIVIAVIVVVILTA